MNEGGHIDITQTGEKIYYADVNVVVNIFKSAYFHIFGEFFTDDNVNKEYDPTQCQTTLGYGSHEYKLNNISPTFSVFDTVMLVNHSINFGDI